MIIDKFGAWVDEVDPNCEMDEQELREMWKALGMDDKENEKC